MTNKEIIIKISTPGGGKPFMKQLPFLEPTWGNCKFYINEEIRECDLWVVYGGLQKPETVFCPQNGTLFITTEPISVKKHRNKFLKQFAAIMTSHKNVEHPNIIANQQALPWWVGHKVETKETKYEKTYDELKNSISPKKQKIASIIVSNKTFTKNHRKRYAFLKTLREELGNKIDIFGIGFNPIDDKWDAIAPYKYHIALENYPTEDYWTEKLSDVFLGEAYPIYYGCKNIHKYFPNNSLSVIDINRPQEAVNKIKELISSDTYERSIEEIKKSKNMILDKYQIFPMLFDYANTNPTIGEKIATQLEPELENRLENFLMKIKNKFI